MAGVYASDLPRDDSNQGWTRHLELDDSDMELW